MKKLKIKVFLTIFLILTTFVFGVFLINNSQNYRMKKDNIQSILERLTISLKDINSPEPPLNDNFDPNKDKLDDNLDRNKIFLDFTVYTILLDENGNYQEMINHTEEEIDESKIKLVAEEIIEKHESEVHIGNLYIEKYSYAFSKNNTLIIIDNSTLNNELIKTFFVTSILFILLEIIVFLISYFLTKWIIKPVVNSFEKQKQFIEDASHELKTPLSIIIASADTFYLKQETKWVDNIKNEAERMTKLVTDLLDLAKSEKNNKVSYSSTNLSKLIESSILTFEGIFYEKNIQLDYKIEENISFKCNAEQIKQLICILLDNAINHSEDNGKVIINLKKNKSELILEVKNKGTPIKKEDYEKIFERFYRSDESRNRNNNRYGLGLAIAKNIVENHNGKIIAFSNNGYTTFKITWNQK